MFIVFEGLDCSGKTSVIKELEKKLNGHCVYNKGLCSKTKIGKIAARFPSTFLFLIEQIWTTFSVVLPALKKGKIVLQDRYDLSVITYPSAQKWYNQVLIKVLGVFLKKADYVIYLTVSLAERQKRLLVESDNEYHKKLLESELNILNREKAYLEKLEIGYGRTLIVDTTNQKAKDIAQLIQDSVIRF